MKRDERGLSESVQWTVLAPLVLLCLVGVIQGGVWWNARTVAQQAAGAGADTASFAGPAAAREAALGVAQRRDLRSVEVAVIDRGATWEVVVSATAQVFLPFGQSSVRGRAIAVKERR